MNKTAPLPCSLGLLILLVSLQGLFKTPLCQAQDAVSHPVLIDSPVKYPLFEGDYGIQAVANLSSFRMKLFKQTEEAMKQYKNADPPGHRRFDLFNPFISCPPGTTLDHVGNGSNVINGIVDGSKLLCVPLQPQVQEGCNIYSFGCNNQYEFEEAMLKLTPCKIYTFDCTVDGHSLDPARHFFFKKCVSDADTNTIFSNTVTFHQVVAEHDHKEVFMLKIDVEGYELALFGSWTEHLTALPKYIAVEVHHTHVWGVSSAFLTPRPGKEAEAANYDFMWGRPQLSQGELSLFFMHMANLGYAILSREDNPQGTYCCSEYTFMRVEGHKVHRRPKNNRAMHGLRGHNAHRKALGELLSEG